MRIKSITSYCNSAKMLVQLLLDIPFLLVWHIERLIPRNKNMWVFSSWFGERYSDSSRALFEYVSRQHTAIRCVWILKNADLVASLRRNGIEAYRDGTFAAVAILLRTGKIFSITGDEFSLRFIHGADYYELWHGMPLKQILQDDTLDVGGLGKIGRLKKKCTWFAWESFLFYKKRFTVTNADFFTAFLQSAFSLPEHKIIKSGLPRCDRLFTPKDEPLVERLHANYPGCKILMYMPTFRTSAWTGEIFNPFSAAYQFDEKAFNATLAQKNIVFLYKPHFYDLKVIGTKAVSDRFITITDDDFDDLYSLCGHIDILMTDYSSIYFDFIATKKPVVLAPFDLEHYTQTARKLYFDYTALEGVRGNNWSEILTLLQTDAYRPVSAAAIQKFAAYVDGKSAEKLYRAIVSP